MSFAETKIISATVIDVYYHRNWRTYIKYHNVIDKYTGWLSRFTLSSIRTFNLYSICHILKQEETSIILMVFLIERGENSK